LLIFIVCFAVLGDKKDNYGPGQEERGTPGLEDGGKLGERAGISHK
jgi:hypothetical protein